MWIAGKPRYTTKDQDRLIVAARRDDEQRREIKRLRQLLEQKGITT
jgi:hypothetical protein